MICSKAFIENHILPKDSDHHHIYHILSSYKENKLNQLPQSYNIGKYFLSLKDVTAQDIIERTFKNKGPSV